MTHQPPPQGPEPLSILFAEDDRVAAELVMDAFARDPGLTVLYAADGGAALSLIQREKLAAAVLDIRMPVLDGLYLLLTIRESPRTATLPVGTRRARCCASARRSRTRSTARTARGSCIATSSRGT